MSSSRGDERNSWASYTRAARQRTGKSQADVAREIGVARHTIGRWEQGRFRPDSAREVVLWAQAVGVDPAEALAAAGFNPTLPAPTEPPPPPDREMELINRARVDERTKQRMREYLLRTREQDEQRRLEVLRMMADRDAS